MVSEGKTRVGIEVLWSRWVYQTRRMIERVIRNRYQWSGQKISQEGKDAVVEKLSKLGFRKEVTSKGL